MEYKNLKINGDQPGSLIFYVNGKKMAEPILRCFSHLYADKPSIVTTLPLTLEIRNKKYGYK